MSNELPAVPVDDGVDEPKKKRNLKPLLAFVALLAVLGSGVAVGVGVGKTLATADEAEEDEQAPDADEAVEAATDDTVGPSEALTQAVAKAESGDEGADAPSESDAASQEASALPIGRELSVREELALLRSLKERVDLLEARERSLAAREAEVAAREIALGTRETSLTKTAEEVEAAQEAHRKATDPALATVPVLQPEPEPELVVDDDQLAVLSKRVKSMKPKVAAEMLGQVDVRLATQVLETLDARSAGKIFSAMPPAVSAPIAERMAQDAAEKTSASDDSDDAAEASVAPGTLPPPVVGDSVDATPSPS